MAQLPTIASTAGRRIMPSADLRVEGVSPAAFGAAVGAGLQQIGDAGADAGKAVQQFQLAKQEETNRLAEFDRQTTFVAFGSDQATKLEEAKRGLSGPAQDFTKSTMATFDADAAAFLEKVPERDRHAWQARMGQLRAGFAGDALRAEFGQRDSYYKTTIADSLGKLQNGAMQSPDKLADWLAQGDAIIGASGLSAQDKLEYATRWKGAVSVAAAQGDVMRDPEGAITRLGGVDHVTALEATGKVSASGAAGAVAEVLHGAGLPANVVAGVLGNLEVESGFRHQGASGDGGTAHGLAQWRHERVDNFKKIMGVDVRQSTLAQQAEFIAWELKNPKAAGMTTAQRDAILKAKSPEEAARLVDKHYERSDGATREARAIAARKYAGVPAVKVAAAGAAEIDPRYAEIPVEARTQLIESAQREIDRRQGVAAQAEQQAHNDWLNTFMNELNDGKAGAADIEAARKSGVLTDFDEINRAQSVVEARTKQQSDLTTYNAMWAANQQFNPYDDNTKRAVEAGYREAVKNGNAPLAAAAAIWQRTGVMPASAANALRGGMASTDANQVARAASVASNMLQRNPNAFAGVQGGNDIEQAAALYSHYVNDLGLTAQDAAQRVTQRNAPDVRRRVDVNKPAIDAFRTKLRKTDVGNLLSNTFGGWLSIDPEFTAPEQVNAAAQDYADFAAEHYEQHGDEGAAQTYAMAQMQKLYGVVNGRIMKFPPTRAYPPVMGSHDYVFLDAQRDIKGATGRDIPADRIYLMPIPTRTAEAFRAGQKVPYSIHYIDKVNGQDVYRTIPGQEFTADTGRAQREAAGEFGRAQAERRRRDESIKATLRSRGAMGTYN